MPARHRFRHPSQARCQAFRTLSLPLGVVLGLGLSDFGPLAGRVQAAPGPIQEVVRSICLSAFETELAQSGKTAPEGMASFACNCVADRITSGSSLASARSSCRDATSKRYPI